MKMKSTLTPFEVPAIQSPAAFTQPVFTRLRTLRYAGPVTRAATERTLKSIEKLVDDAPDEEIFLFVTSTGGPTGTAMNFYDTVRTLLQPRLTTIGSGDVDSSGIVLFLTGTRRYVTAHTTMLLHPAGRHFDSSARYTVKEMEAMLKEDRLKDEQYASVVATASGGRLSVRDVLEFMEAHTVLSPAELVVYGLAHAVLE